ncbi:hypothetical protein ACROYT_G016327 [Oculina patagonica]
MHLKRHRLKNLDIRVDDTYKFSFICLSKIPDTYFPLFETVNGHFTKQCHSFAVTDNKEPKRVDWSYDRNLCRHIITGDANLEKKAILGSPVLWTNKKGTAFVVGVVGSEDDALSLLFFDKGSLKVSDLPRPVTLNELPNEVFADNITLRWNRSADAPNYRVYQMIDNQDAQWERVKTTTDNTCVIRVERGKSYQFKVTGVNGNLEGKESNIRRVKVLDVPMPVEFIDLPSEKSGNELTLKWTKPCDNGTPIMHYTVYQRILNEDGSAPADWTPLKQVKQQLEYEVSGMETGKTYEFQMTATNKCGEGPKVPEAIKRVTVSIDPSPDNLISFLEFLWKLFYVWWNGSTG